MYENFNIETRNRISNLVDLYFQTGPKTGLITCGMMAKKLAESWETVSPYAYAHMMNDCICQDRYSDLVMVEEVQHHVKLPDGPEWSGRIFFTFREKGCSTGRYARFHFECEEDLLVYAMLRQ
jgi:hypothetical protein